MLARHFQGRRERLWDILPGIKPSVVVYGRETLYRTPKVKIPFSQSSDFFYLTGLKKPGCILTINECGGRPFSTIFVTDQPQIDENWKNKDMEYQKIRDETSVDLVRPISEFPSWVKLNLINKHEPFTSFPVHQSPIHPFRLASPYIDLLKVVKDDIEIAVMKKASAISVKAHKDSLSTVQPGVSEGVIATRFYHSAFESGATGLAYPTVCASGDNALCLHYLENNKIMKEGDCLMMDAGCELNGYASDFTRTVPIGKVDPQRLDILRIVEYTKDLLVKKAKNGEFQNLNHLHEASVDILQRELIGAELNLSYHEMQEVYPHGVTHWIGTDVHDADTVPHSYKLRQGCAFTVEPGLYFARKCPFIPENLQGLGVRFEDTVILEK